MSSLIISSLWVGHSNNDTERQRQLLEMAAGVVFLRVTMVARKERVDYTFFMLIQAKKSNLRILKV